MRNFYQYMRNRSITEQQLRIARLMVERGVEPYTFIGQFFDHPPLLTEFLGGFFKRLGNAWNAFWKNPNKPEDNPENRLEAAKAAMIDLQNMLAQNVGADQGHLQVVLNGLEQSLTIMGKIEPSIRQLSSGIMQYQKTGEAIPTQGILPEDLEQKWMAIMTKRDEIINGGEKEEIKAQKLFANDDELMAFKHELENIHQGINDYEQDQGRVQYKKQIENFLRRIDNDTTFREIQNLLDIAKRRAGASNMLVKPPEGYGEVQQVWRQIAGTTADPNQHKQQMIAWYGTLAPNHPVKAFIHQELQKGELGNNENEVFYKYAYNWMTKNPHHMLGST